MIGDVRMRKELGELNVGGQREIFRPHTLLSQRQRHKQKPTLAKCCTNVMIL